MFLTHKKTSYCKKFGNHKGVKINSVAYVAIIRKLVNIPLISVSANDASASHRFMCCVRNGTCQNTMNLVGNVLHIP